MEREAMSVPWGIGRPDRPPSHRRIMLVRTVRIGVDPIVQLARLRHLPR
jgi:hypothetical protein